MRVARRTGSGRRFGLSWRTRFSWERGARRARRAVGGAGMLALALPLAWPSGAGGQHLSVPSAAATRSAVIRLADWVTGHTGPAPAVPRQQTGTAAGTPGIVPVSATRGVKHATGRRPGKGPGQRPAWAPHGPSGETYTTRPAPRGFDPATSTPVAPATTATSDLFKNADGSYTRRIYQNPVNYRTAAGAWAPIDVTLVKASGHRWREKSNSVLASFGAAGSDTALGTLASEDGPGSMSFSLAGAGGVAGVADGPSVTYPGILPDTNVTETATATGIGESLALDSASAPASWVFPLRLTGLSASLERGSVDLTDAAGNVVWVIPPATARSGPVNLASADPQAASQLSYQLVTDSKGLALRMTLDPSWLAAPGRVFPVTVGLESLPSAPGSAYAEQRNGTARAVGTAGSGFLPSGARSASGGTVKDIDLLNFPSPDGRLPGQHVTAASLNLFDAYAAQCTAVTSMYAYQAAGPSHGSPVAQWTGRAPSQACSNVAGKPGQGAWISLAFNPAGLALLDKGTAGNAAPGNAAPGNAAASNTGTGYGLTVAPSLTDPQSFKQFDSASASSVLSSAGGTCTGNCAPYLQVTTTTDVPPQIDSQYPPDNYNAPTLTPELLATGHDPDTYPNASVQYVFTVFSSTGTQLATSGLIASGYWTVPAGKLTWGQSYYWTVQDYDGQDYSPSPQADFFSTPVPQPLVTSGLSQNGAGPGFDPQTGDWTTSATDAQVPTVGPALEVTRDYNSTDPRISGAFGAGWSSVLDMKVSPGQPSASGTTATEVVTYPDGEEVAFGLTASGSYTAPPGRYSTLAAVSGGGFTLTDKNDTVYTFTQSRGSGVFGITSIADALGHTETFGYNGGNQVTTVTSASGRTLTMTWASPSGAAYPHVQSVVTDDATAGNPATAQTWSYTYSGDELSAACPPASTTACTAYTYTSGSDYPAAVLDSGPQSYWRLDEASGSTAASSVLLNEGTDNGTYSGVTLGAAGPLAGSSATSAAFDGTSSSVSLPSNLVFHSSYATIALWFKTTSTSAGMLFSTGHSQPGTSSPSSGAMPVLYVGSDGKLYGHFWNNTVPGMSSPAAVNDGKWHHAVLTAAGNTQYLYLDGQQIGSLSGQLNNVDPYDMVGTGVFNNDGWPAAPSGNVWSYFNGDISDVAFWTRSLTAAETQALYAAGTRPAALLATVTRPSGSVYAQVSYDPLTGRASRVTDDNGGNWQVAAPSVSGSSQVWVASVLGAHPKDYWRLADTGASQAVNLMNCGCDAAATYYSVTEGATGGPFADTTVASFDGTSSYLAMPTADQGTTGPGSIGLWFKTTGSSEVLFSQQNQQVSANASSASFDPMLYVGADGKLVGEFWINNIANAAMSTMAVNDGKWHYAVLAAGTDTQSLYVDGVLQATVSGTLSGSPQPYVAVGAGYLGDTWPDISSSTVQVRYFTGDIAEVAWYPAQLTTAQVTAQWNVSKYAAGLTPVQTETVTDPGGKTPAWTYDLLNGGRLLTQTDANGYTTSYGYDISGFQDETTLAGRFVTETGYDVRGNRVSKTTCQNQAANQCSTSYWSYYPDDTSASLTPDPRNDLMASYADGRSASATDPAYRTTYAYNTLGELTGLTTPPVAGFPSGRTTSYAYTDGTTTVGGYNGAIPPKGLPYQVTTPGGAVTTTLYYANGDIAQVTDPDGQRTGYGYDGLGRKTSQTVYSDSYPNGLTTTYAYDANGQVVTETDPAVTNRVTGAVHTAQTTTSYDADGDVTSQTVADLTGGDTSRTVTRTYNVHDQLTSETDAARGVTHWTYNPFGDKASMTDADGNVTDYRYDGDRHLLTTTLENYTGSPPGSQTAAPLVQESRSYDGAGRLASVTDAMGRHTDYTYTDNGLLASVTAADPTRTSSFTTDWYSYDGAGNLTEHWTNNGDTDTTYTVDAAGRVTQQGLNSGLNRTTSITYTPDDQQASVTKTGPDGVTQATSYSYDPAGNVLSQSVTDPGAGGPVAWFPLAQTSGPAVTDSVSGGQPASGDSVTWNGTSAGFDYWQSITTGGPVVDTTGSFTVAAWVNLTATGGSSSQTAVSQDAGTDSAFYLKYYPGSGGWEFTRPQTDTMNPSIATADSASTAPAAAGTWTFLTGTYDANTGAMTLYVNGSASAGATDATPITSSGPLAIGRAKWDGTNGDFFGGQIADVQVYPRALSSGEVSSLYGLGQGGGDVTTGQLTTTWTRDQRGLPTSMTNPDGAVTGYSYDEAGRLAVTTDPTVTTETYGGSPVTARPVTMTGYDTFGDTTETTDANGNATTYGYDGDGRETSRTLPPYTPPGTSTPLTAQDTRAYDGNGQLISVTDALHNLTKYGYDQLGDQVSVTAPDNSVTTTAYDANGEPLSVTGPTGAQTQATWDYLGRQLTGTQVERYTGSGTAAYTTNYAYGTGGWLSQVTSPGGVTTQYTYDPAGETTSVTDGATHVTGYAYDSLGRRTSVTYPDGTSQVTGYDAVGDVTNTWHKDASGTVLTTTSATFDGEGRQLSATDARGHATTFTYDPTGLISQEVQPVSAASAITTSFGYDATGNKTRYTDGNGSSWQYTYNSWGLQESRIEPATSQYPGAADSTFTTAYDADGRPASVTEPGGVTVTDSYNNLSELTGQSGSGADAATAARSFGYDPAGNLTSAGTSSTAPSGSPSNATSESFTYNDRGQVLTAAGSAGSASYGYNGDGQVTSVADAAGTTGYSYDSAGRLATLADPATGTTATYSYNNDSQVSQISYGTGADTRAFGYDSLHRLTSDTLKDPSGATVASVGYGYNANGQVTSLSTAGLAGPSSSTYTYDQAGRLASWDNGTTTTQYGYDANGNLTQNGSTTYTYDARDEMTSDGTNSYGYTARGTPSSESAPGGSVAVTFDAYGDQASAGTQSYVYDALGRVTADTASGGGGYAFSYAGKTGTIASDSVSTYTWDPSGGVLAGTGVAGGGAGQGVLALTSSHGDVLGQFTASGSAVSGSRAYDPWGTVTATSGSLAGLVGFQSAWADPATGKSLMGARWYDPLAGGFTSADTVQVSPVPDPVAANPFAYAGDDPLDISDPTGHCWSGFGWACAAGHAVASGFDRARHAVASGFGSALGFAASYGAAMLRVDEMMAAIALRPVRNVVHTVADAASRGIHVAATYVARSVTYARHVYHAVTHWAKRAYHRVVHVVRTAWHRAVRRVRSAVRRVRSAVHRAAGAVTRGVRRAAAATGHFASEHAAQVGGAVAGVAVFAGCEAATEGAGTVGCAAASGAAANAVSYAITAAQTGRFSWSALGETSLQGAAEGAAGGALGELAGTAGGSLGKVLGAACGGESFAAATPVLLATGKTEPISRLHAGQKVLAADTRTGRNQPETVTAVLVRRDTDLYDLTVRAGKHAEVIRTTSSHLFWVPATRGHGRWVKAAALRHGTHLRTPGGASAVVAGGQVPRQRDGWMWDLTVPGNNDHDFYVVTSVASILVHNVSCPVNWVDEGPDLRNSSRQPGAWYDYQSGASGARSNAVTGRSMVPQLEMSAADGSTVTAKFDSIDGEEAIDRKMNPFFSEKAVDEARRQAATAAYNGFSAVYEVPNEAAYGAMMRFMQYAKVSTIAVRIAG